MDTVKVDPSENDVTIQPQLHRPYASVISVGASSTASTTPTLPSSSSSTSLNHRHLTKSSPFVHGSNNRSTLSDAAVNNSEKKFQPSGSSLVGEGGIPLHRPYLPARLTHTGVSSRSGRFFHQKAADVYWNMYLKTVNQPPSAAAPIACSSTSLPEPNCAKKTSPSPLQQQQVYNSGSSTSSTNPTDQTTTLSISTAGVSRETVPPLTRNERADLKDGSHYPLAHLLSPPHLSGVSSNYRRQPRVVQEQQPLNLRTYRKDPPTSRSADQQQQPIPHISEYPGVGAIGFTGPLLMSIATLIDAGFNTNALLENKSAAATCTPLQSNPQDPTAIAASSSKQSRPKMVENEAQSSSPPNKNNAKPVYEFLSPPHPSTVSIDCHPNGGQNLALKQPLNLGNYIKDPPLPLMSPSVDQQQPIPHISEYPSVGPIGFTGPLPMSVATLIDARFNSNAIRPTLEDKSVAAAYALLLLQSNPQGPSASSSKQSRSSIVKDETHSSLPPNKNSAKPVHKLKTAWFQRHTGGDAEAIKPIFDSSMDLKTEPTPNSPGPITREAAALDGLQSHAVSGYKRKLRGSTASPVKPNYQKKRLKSPAGTSAASSSRSEDLFVADKQKGESRAASRVDASARNNDSSCSSKDCQTKMKKRKGRRKIFRSINFNCS